MQVYRTCLEQDFGEVALCRNKVVGSTEDRDGFFRSQRMRLLLVPNSESVT
jgi:hypothetical protein